MQYIYTAEYIQVWVRARLVLHVQTIPAATREEQPENPDCLPKIYSIKYANL